ncbi:hypothetical protein MHH85_08240 [Viridibacillus sp. FSL E2-0187]|uniref:hypothetical protein n=1 Tax=Viridibacillus sp. FSL E2-0187 TaxID=2921362 RepID=UPI0030F9841A
MYETEISEERELADYSIEYIRKEPAPKIFGYNIKSSWFEFGVNEEIFNEELMYIQVIVNVRVLPLTMLVVK